MQRHDYIWFTAILSAALLLLAPAAQAFAQAPRLVWEYDDNPANPADGFIIYATDATSGKVYHYKLEDASLREFADFAVVMNLLPGRKYTLHMTAYNETGQSADSDAIVFTPPAWTPPENVLPTNILINWPVNITIH